jgi:hypothetical protein
MIACLTCNKLFIKKRAKFCSRSCSASYNNRVYPKRIKINKCSECGTLISNSSVTCSKDCLSKRRLRLSRNKSDIFSGEHICPKCKEKRASVEFYVRKNGRLHGYCKYCLSESRSIRNTKIKLLAIEYKGGICQKCGYNKYIGALEFHHRDFNTKDFGINKRRVDFEKMKDELDKCDLLCANCHREIHAEDRNIRFNTNSL